MIVDINKLVTDMAIRSYVQGALQAFMSIKPDETKKVLFEKAVHLTVKEHWNQPRYKEPLIDFLKHFKVDFICFKCGGDIGEGQALDNTWVGSDDFGGDAGQRGTTISKIGPPIMKKVCKCIFCGHSFTK